MAKFEDMPQEVQAMMHRRANGSADPTIARHLQRILVDRDVFKRSEADGIWSPEVLIVETYVVKVATGAFRVRLLAPHRDFPLPLVVHMHGGAFILGSIDWPDVDAKCRQLCLDVQCAVVTIDYRLAPEHPYPTQIEDCYSALIWCVENAATLGIDPSRIATLGESAGGNLAAVVSIMARDRGGPSIAAQVLEVPLTDLKTPQAHLSFSTYALGFGLDAQTSILANLPLYCTEFQRSEAYASPLHAPDLGGLPPTLILTAEFDILRESGALYAQRLQAACVKVQHYRGAGQNHGSASMFQTWPPAKIWFDQISQFLKSVFQNI